jgi:hypothetical protein
VKVPRPNGTALIGTLRVEKRHTLELIALFRRRIVRPPRKMLREILDAAVNMLAGSLYAR